MSKPVATDPTSTITYCSTFIPDDPEPIFVEESALIELLAAGVLFMGWGPREGNTDIRLLVLCNDLFYWASADAESCSPYELRGLYDAWAADKKWGTDIWCCFHRNLQPQAPVRRDMEKDGVWSEELAALPTPAPS